MGKRRKMRRQSTIDEESVQEDTYEEMVRHLTQSLKERDRTIRILESRLSRLELSESRNTPGVSSAPSTSQTAPQSALSVVSNAKVRASVRTEPGNDEDIDSRERSDRLEEPSRRSEPATSFSFKDIEESLCTFNGEDEYTPNKFINDFESAAEVFNWTDLQKFVYSRRLIKGAARLALRTTSSINSWNDLKLFLKKEFEVEENSADLHAKLRQRRKLTKETYYEYFLSIRELAAKANLEESAIMKYTIDGINDTEVNKLILYGARDLEEFKTRLRTPKAHKTSWCEPTDGIRRRSSRHSKLNCYSCGIVGHLAKDCPRRNRGPKCFTCNRYGHKGSECKQARRNTTEANVSFVREEKSVKEDMCATVTLNGLSFSALIDDAYNLLQRTDVKNPIHF